jgi:serine/threonine-protein kinase
MASVFLAKARGHGAFEKWVAVKVINPQLALDQSFVRMFLDEARLVAKLNHPNICSVLDFGAAENTYFLTMEYLHGESLSALNRAAQKRGGLPDSVAARIIADAARGLHAAHELKLPDGRLANVVHRDVSPQNIFVLYDGVTKVVDFGIARSVDRTSERTSTGIIKGKLSYMAPEQLRNAEPDRRLDVFALGIVLWEITVGKRLFQREHEAATMCAVLQDPIPSPSSVRADYPELLETIVLRALERDPNARYQTAAELARELERFVALSGQMTGAEEVASVMHSHFAKKIAVREKLLNESAPGAPTDTMGNPVNDLFVLRTPAASTSESLDVDSGRQSLEPPSAVARKPSIVPQTGVLNGASASHESVPIANVLPSRVATKSRALAIALCAVAAPLLAFAIWLATRAPANQHRTVIYAGPTLSPPNSAQATPQQSPTVELPAPANPAAPPQNTLPIAAPPLPRESAPPELHRGDRSAGSPRTTTATTRRAVERTANPAEDSTPPRPPAEPAPSRPRAGPRPATDFNQL